MKTISAKNIKEYLKLADPSNELKYFDINRLTIKHMERNSDEWWDVLIPLKFHDNFCPIAEIEKIVVFLELPFKIYSCGFVPDDPHNLLISLGIRT